MPRYHHRRYPGFRVPLNGAVYNWDLEAEAFPQDFITLREQNIPVNISGYRNFGDVVSPNPPKPNVPPPPPQEEKSNSVMIVLYIILALMILMIIYWWITESRKLYRA